MGSKNGKYDFEYGASMQNDNEALPTFLSDLNGTILNKKTRKDEASLPKCIHRDVLKDSLSANTDNVSLVWLDADIHQRASNIDTEIKLKNLIHYIRVFDRVDACERYIKQTGRLNNSDYVRKEKLLVVISTTLALTIIPHLHDLSQVKYIYVYGKSKTFAKAHQDWLRKYNKVKGIFNSSRSLIAQISQDQN